MRPAPLAVLVLAACSDPEVRMDCLRETRSEERAEWVLKCAEAANPRSDEEGEDLVRQCEISSRSLFCERAHHLNKGQGTWVPCRDLTAPEDLAACRSAGWSRDAGQ